MIKQKLKTCSGCDQEKVIWKSQGKNKFCKDCWYQQTPAKKLKTTTPINRFSDKRKKEMPVYDKRRLAFLALHKFCQAKLVDCTRMATEVHHKKGRVGEDYLNIATWLATCNSCHHWIEMNPEKAKELGLSESRLNIQTNEQT